MRGGRVRDRLLTRHDALAAMSEQDIRLAHASTISAKVAGGIGGRLCLEIRLVLVESENVSRFTRAPSETESVAAEMPIL